MLKKAKLATVFAFYFWFHVYKGNRCCRIDLATKSCRFPDMLKSLHYLKMQTFKRILRSLLSLYLRDKLFSVFCRVVIHDLSVSNQKTYGLSYKNVVLSARKKILFLKIQKAWRWQPAAIRLKLSWNDSFKWGELRKGEYRAIFFKNQKKRGGGARME